MLAKKTRKVLSLALVLIMVISMFPMLAMAEEGGHEHDEVGCEGSFVAGTPVAPTCTVDGYTTYTCDSCGASYDDDVAEATSHSRDAEDAGVVTAPTELAQGYTTYTCVGCRELYQADFVPATGEGTGEPKTNPENMTIKFDSDSKTAELTITEEAAKAAEIIIPAVVYDNDGAAYTVTVVKGFKNGNTLIGNTTIKKIVFPGTVVSFPVLQNTAVEEVVFGEGITALNGSMFYSCKNLSKVTLPSTLQSLINVFKDCTALESIDLPAGLTTFQSDFSGSGLKSITIPAGVSEISNSAFKGCANLESVVFEGSLTGIAGGAFDGCTNLKTVTVKGSVTTIGALAFSGCTNLKTVTVEGSVTTIGARAFYGCTSLQTVTGEGPVTTIGARAFYKCNNLETPAFVYTSALETIEENTFFECYKLRVGDFDFSNVTTIGEYAFRYAGSRLSNYEYSLDLPSIVTIGARAFSNTTNVNNGLSVTVTSIYLGDSITTIEQYAFAEGRYTESVHIGSGIQTIAKAAFNYVGENTAEGAQITIDAIQSLVNVDSTAFKIDKGSSPTIIWLQEDIDFSGMLTAEELQEAVSAGGTVELEKDAVISKGSVVSCITVNTDVTLTGDFIIYNDIYNASSPMFIIEDGGKLILDGVTIQALRKASAIIKVKSGGTLELKSGTITGAYGTLQTGAVLIENGGTFNMSGGEISGNIFSGNYSAAVFVQYGGTFNMSAGTISGNSGKTGGGVHLFGWSNDYTAKFNMTGGYITGNSVSNVASGGTGGGGVYVLGNASFTLDGGTISNNSSTGDGGGIAIRHLEDQGSGYRSPVDAFVMHSGVVSGNKALGADANSTGCGGGIYVFSSGCSIYGGTISGNTANGHGGGIYVAGDEKFSALLNIYNAAVTANTASVMGGGLWTCPTGDTETYVNNGGAIFGNYATSIGDDVATVGRVWEAYTTLANRVLGGGLVTWYRDGQTTTDPSGGLGGVSDSTRYNADTNAEEVTVNNSRAPYALKAILAGKSGDLALANASVIISGNSASRGGGIGSNGDLIIGMSSGEEYSLTVNKVWSGGELDIDVEITLVIEGYELDSLILNKENGWTKSFNNLPASAIGNISVKETAIPNYTASYSEITQEGNEFFVTVTNTYTPNIPVFPSTPVEIPDPSDPLTDIPDPSDPLTDIPDASDPLTDIPDDLDPLGDAPKTGDGSNIFLFLTIMISCAFGLAVINLPRKKRNED